MSADYEDIVPKVKSTVRKRHSHKYGDAVDGDEIVTVAYFEDPISMESGKFYYGVQLVTGKQLGAGTFHSTYVELVGEKGRTGKLSLHGLCNSEIKRDTYNNLTVVTDAELGKVLVVVVGCGPDLSQDNWYVSFVMVANLQLQEVDQFPCYSWISKSNYVTITANTTTLKDVAGNKILLQQRKEQILHRQNVYKWMKDPRGIPSSIDDSSMFSTLPADQQFGMVKNFDFTSEALQSIGGLHMAGLSLKCKDLHAYEELARYLGGKRPLYEAGRWTSDEEFGYQMLNGVNPIVIKKCEKLPPHFPVTNEMVGPFLNLSLEEEMKAGHIYICDMKVMDGLHPKKNYFNVAPICLLYVNKNKKLVPIAIQLKQGVSEEDKKIGNPIFLPSDNWIDWILAKMYYQSAHSQYHEAFTHYTACHATMEAFSMGTQRNLPNAHPIFKLLIPSFLYTMAINTRARATLINKGGIIDRFFGIGGEGLTEAWKRCGATYNVHTSNIKRWARERGVDDAEQLPGYYYRDDGVKIWDALEKYTGDIIDQYYKTDEDVLNDEELQAWARDIHNNGFPAFDGAPGYEPAPAGHGFPDKMTSKEELTMYCTLIMFTGSAQHASVNFMQYYYYRFVPNASFGVRRPPPAKKGVADYQYFLDSLMDKESAIMSIGTTHLLSQYSQNEKFLGDFHLHLFTEKESTTSQKKFQDTLKGVSDEIKARNEKLPIDVKYTAMLPDKIPNSITI